jgi:hypothetical protein
MKKYIMQFYNERNKNNMQYVDETRDETVNRVMTGMLTTYNSRLFTNYHITDLEVSKWAVENNNLIRNTIINPRMMTLLIDIFNDETSFWSTRLVAINSLKQHLLTQQREQQALQRQPQEQVVVGGFHRRTNKSKHRRSKKSRRSKKYGRH